MKNQVVYFVFSLVVLLACKKDESLLQATFLDLPEKPADYFGFAGINNNLPELGRVLFYDKSLSVNNAVSCGSCHKQVYGFADNAALSHGFDNQLTARNSMPIQNLNFGLMVDINRGISLVPSFQKLFWDGREHDLNIMVLRPILNHIEMGISDTEELAKKLKTIPYYKPLFKKAFDSEEITSQKISEALAWFLRSITSRNTKLDKSFFGSGAQLSALEVNGKNLFVTKYNCNSCHRVEDPNGYAVFGGGFSNIGLNEIYTDEGLAKVTHNSTDVGKFKIPSLRNVALTAPYMHDGRFETLDEVVDHYSNSIVSHPNLDFRLRDINGQVRRMDISELEKKAIVAFLNTLTDFQVVTDPKFASPFKTK